MDRLDFLQAVRVLETGCIMLITLAIIARLMDQNITPLEKESLAQALAISLSNRVPFGMNHEMHGFDPMEYPDNYS